MLSLLANTVPARRKPRAVLDTLQRVALDATALCGARAEAEEIVTGLLSRLDR
jgi:hypothetical protein